jgi:hypothetical protein
MPAIAQIEGFFPRPPVAISFKSSFNEDLTRLNAKGNLSTGFQAPSLALVPEHHQLVERLLDCLIVPPLNSMQKKQEHQNHNYLSPCVP